MTDDVLTKTVRFFIHDVPRVIVVTTLAVGVYSQGPLDFARTAYATMCGDTWPLKEQMINYCRERIGQQVSLNYIKQSLSPVNKDVFKAAVDGELAKRLGQDGETNIDAMLANTSTTKLWDVTEDVADSAWDRWVWPPFR